MKEKQVISNKVCKKDYLIRKSTDQDFAKIKGWLEQQNADGVEETFFCQLEYTHRRHLNANLTVCVDKKTGDPVGYQWTDEDVIDLLEVRADMRGRGIGSMMVDRIIEKTIGTPIVALEVLFTSEHSEGFWKRMGFTIYDHENKHGYLLLPKKHKVDRRLTSVPVDLHFYPNTKQWDVTTKPLESYSLIGKKSKDGTIYLDRRISVFSKLPEWDGDVMVEIIIDGEQVFFDKAKRPKAYALGVREQRYRSAVYIDKLTPNKK